MESFKGRGAKFILLQGTLPSTDHRVPQSKAHTVSGACYFTEPHANIFTKEKHHLIFRTEDEQVGWDCRLCDVVI